MNHLNATKRVEPRGQINCLAAVAIGVGGMVGGGIFAVLGLAVQLAHGGTPVAFLLAGCVALVTSHSYACLSVRYPGQGGTVEFVNQAFGPGLFSGGLNVLLLISYIVMLSLYANAFGSYGASLLPNGHTLWKHLLISLVITVMTVLNVKGTAVVGEAEEWIVGLKILILLFFVALGIGSVNWGSLAPAQWSHPLQLASGGMIIFLAYEGFELIANTAEAVKNPRTNLLLAYYAAVGFVMLLYLAISAVTVGNLSVQQILAARDYALAESARPFLGDFGFGLIAVAALLSTASAINATLYGAARISYIIAKEGELPGFLERKVWSRPIEGLLLTSVATLLLANTLDLSSISIMGSAGFLIIFAVVNTANFRLTATKSARKWISLLGTVVCLGALGALVWQTAVSSPAGLLVLAAMAGGAFGIEAAYRKMTGRAIKKPVSA